MAENKQMAPNVMMNVEEMSQHDSEEDMQEYEDPLEVAQWLQPLVSTANDGLISTACLMLGMGAVSQDINAMILTGYLGLVAGACSAAFGGFISAEFTSHDIETGQEIETQKDPLRAGAVLALAFGVGAMVPVLVALFMDDFKFTLGLVEGPISVVLAVFGWIGPFLDGAPGFRSVMRVLLWGWVAMVLIFGLVIDKDW